MELINQYFKIIKVLEKFDYFLWVHPYTNYIYYDKYNYYKKIGSDFLLKYKDIDSIFGISDEELTKRFETAINRDKDICKNKGLPIAKYDNKNKRAYLEYPDGNKIYVKD